MTFEKILITRMKYIGDIVLTTPIVHAVRDAFPAAQISYLGDEKAVSLLENNPYLDEIIPYKFRDDSFGYQMAMYRRMYRSKFDLTIDLYSNPRSALLTFATRARVRIGWDTRGRGKLYTIRVPDDGRVKSAIDHHYQALAPLGITPTHRRTEIFLTPREREKSLGILASLNVPSDVPLVAVHPGATWPNKVWGREQFEETVRRIVRETDAHVLVSPGPNDRELVEYLAMVDLHRVHRLPMYPVRTLAGILSCCAVFISNDCGPMHIGVAVGTKTIGIFGPEPPEIWFPYSPEEGHLSLFTKLPCSPCRTTQCHRAPGEEMECMRLITADTVVQAVKDRLPHASV